MILLYRGCGLPCAKRPDLPCLSGMYVDVIEFHTLAIPSGIPAGQVSPSVLYYTFWSAVLIYQVTVYLHCTIE